MSPTNHDPLTPAEQDDADWGELLAGRSAPDAAPNTRREAELMRRALARQAAREAAARNAPAELSAQELASGRQRLLFRLQREGLLAERKAPWKSAGFAYALAATFAAVAIVPWLVLQPPSGTVGLPPQVNGATKGLLGQMQVIAATDPEAQARALAEALRAQGFGVQLESYKDDWLVRVRWLAPPELSQQVQQRGGQALPEQELLVQFSRPQP